MVERTEKPMGIDFEFKRLAEAFFFFLLNYFFFPSWRHIYSTISNINLVLHLSNLCFLLFLRTVECRGWHAFSVMGQIVNILCSAVQTVSVTTTQLRCCGMKAARDNVETNEHGSIPLTLYLWTLKFEFHIIFTCHKIFLFSKHLEI